LGAESGGLIRLWPCTFRQNIQRVRIQDAVIAGKNELNILPVMPKPQRPLARNRYLDWLGLMRRKFAPCHFHELSKGVSVEGIRPPSVGKRFPATGGQINTLTPAPYGHDVTAQNETVIQSLYPVS
jgi:hypothetical protein